MLFLTHAAKFPHIAEDHHLGLLDSDALEIVERSRHARRIGIIGIDDQPVVRGLLQL